MYEGSLNVHVLIIQYSNGVLWNINNIIEQLLCLPPERDRCFTEIHHSILEILYITIENKILFTKLKYVIQYHFITRKL